MTCDICKEDIDRNDRPPDKWRDKSKVCIVFKYEEGKEHRFMTCVYCANEILLDIESRQK